MFIRPVSASGWSAPSAFAVTACASRAFAIAPARSFSSWASRIVPSAESSTPSRRQSSRPWASSVARQSLPQSRALARSPRRLAESKDTSDEASIATVSLCFSAETLRFVGLLGAPRSPRAVDAELRQQPHSRRAAPRAAVGFAGGARAGHDVGVMVFSAAAHWPGGAQRHRLGERGAELAHAAAHRRIPRPLDDGLQRAKVRAPRRGAAAFAGAHDVRHDAVVCGS